MTVGEEALGSQAGAQRGASACVYFSLFGSGYAGLGDTALGYAPASVARWGQACRRVTEGRRNRLSALGKAFRSGGTESSNPACSSEESSANSILGAIAAAYEERDGYL